MALTTLTVTAIHLGLVFASLFLPPWRCADRERIRVLIGAIEKKAATHAENKVPEKLCRDLATACYFRFIREMRT